MKKPRAKITMTQYEQEVLTSLYTSLDYAKCEGTVEEESVINGMIKRIEAKHNTNGTRSN